MADSPDRSHRFRSCFENNNGIRWSNMASILLFFSDTVPLCEGLIKLQT